MSYIKGIFEKATIRGIADYLLFGLGPDEDERSYEERLDEPYERFEKAVKKYDKNPTSELLDLSNEVTSETASVYTEIGMQIAILLMQDMLKNIRREQQCSSSKNEEKGYQILENESVIDAIYQAKADAFLKEKRTSMNLIFQELSKKIEKENSSEKIGLWIKDAVAKINRDIFDYGKAAYLQGFKNAVNILKKN